MGGRFLYRTAGTADELRYKNNMSQFKNRDSFIQWKSDTFELEAIILFQKPMGVLTGSYLLLSNILYTRHSITLALGTCQNREKKNE